MGQLNFNISQVLSGNAYHLLRQISLLLNSWDFHPKASFLSLEIGRKIRKPLKCKHVEHLMCHDTGNVLQATNLVPILVFYFLPCPFHLHS